MSDSVPPAYEMCKSCNRQVYPVDTPPTDPEPKRCGCGRFWAPKPSADKPAEGGQARWSSFWKA